MQVTELLQNLACGLAPMLVCMAAGSAVGPGANRMAGADMLVGLGLAGGALTALAVFTHLPLSILMLLTASVSILASLARRRLPGGLTTWTALALLLPVLLRAAGTQATLWDEFWHWLPNAAYAYTHDALVQRDLPPSFSQWPAYPQALPLAIASASLLGRRFIESAGAVVNVALLAGYAALLADTLNRVSSRQDRPAQGFMPVALTALATLMALVLNPGLDGEVLLSAYADAATMIAVSALALLGVELLARLKEGSASDPAQLAWRFGFVAAALVNLKQANPVLLILIMAGLAFVMLSERELRYRSAFRMLPRMLGPPIALFLVWRWYVAANFPVGGEAGFRPFTQWNWIALPDTVRSIAGYVRHLPLFHATMWLVTAAGIGFIPGLRRCPEEARWLAKVTAVVWLGYNAFLLLVYMGSMTVEEAQAAADYWRYTPHVALLAVSALAVALAGLRLSTGTVAAVGMFCAFATFGAPWLRRDLGLTPTKRWALFVREVAADMKPLLPQKAKLVLAFGYYPNPFPVIMHYELWQLGNATQSIASADVWEEEDGREVREKSAGANYLLIHDGQGSVTDIAGKLGAPLPENEMLLLARRDGGWEQVRAWPIPAGLNTPR